MDKNELKLREELCPAWTLSKICALASREAVVPGVPPELYSLTFALQLISKHNALIQADSSWTDIALGQAY